MRFADVLLECGTDCVVRALTAIYMGEHGSEDPAWIYSEYRSRTLWWIEKAKGTVARPGNLVIIGAGAWDENNGSQKYDALLFDKQKLDKIEAGRIAGISACCIKPDHETAYLRMTEALISDCELFSAASVDEILSAEISIKNASDYGYTQLAAAVIFREENFDDYEDELKYNLSRRFGDDRTLLRFMIGLAEGMCDYITEVDV